MPLSSGTRLGPYEVVAPIGAGGMGEVYRARDTRLDRTVAVKVLPALLAMDPEFRERFDREARSISALAHPNICTLYDVGDHRFEDGSETRFLVMEYLEGETLGARLERGPVAIDEALTIAVDIASALDKAHKHGVVHRDLKPANVMLTKGGAKLLDFGLAKSSHGGATSPVDTIMPTITSPAGATRTGPLTTQGTILGTIQYMAPEQVEGEEAGPRSDLFSFGALLFEMITGRRAFSGKSHASLLSAILKDEPPPISQLQPMSPPALDRLVRVCLAKDPDDRLQSAHDLLLELRWIQEGGSTVGLPAAVTTHRRNRERIAWIALTAVSALLIVVSVPAIRSFKTLPPSPKVMFTLTIGEIGLTNAFSIAMSPDGRMLAYMGPRDTGRTPRVWVQALDEPQPRSLPGTEGAVAPFWSADSRSIGFAAGGRLQTISVDGGPPQTVCDLPATFFGGSWNADGTILFAVGNSASSVTLARVTAAGGEMTTVAQPDRSEQQAGLFWPQFLPDGRHYVYLAVTSDAGKRAVYLGSLDGTQPAQLVRTPAAAIVAGEFLLYVRDGGLLAQRLNLDRKALEGNPIRIADTVLFGRVNGRVAFTGSHTGVLAYRTGGPTESLSQLTWLNRSGQPIRTVGDPAPFNQIRLSPDERRVAAVLPDPRTLSYNIWTIDLASGIATQALSEETTNDPLWLPDSQSFLFESVRKGKRDFYRHTVGAPTSSLVYESAEDPKWLNDVSRDGKYFLYHLPRPAKLLAVPLSSSKPGLLEGQEPILLAETLENFDGAHFSPDGNWVVYQTSESGDYELWVAAFPAFDNRRRISPRGGSQAWWRGDGKELFYLDPDGKLMSITVAPDPGGPGGVAFRAPVQLFQSPIPRPVMTIDQYAVSADGQRFLFLQPRGDGATASSPITVVVNWTSQKPGGTR